MRSVIVQGGDLEQLVAAVRSVGGKVTHELGIIQAIGADMTAVQVVALREIEGILIRENRKLAVDVDLQTAPDGFDRSDGLTEVIPIDGCGCLRE